MTICALDIATKTGWAIALPEKYIFGTTDLSDYSGDWAQMGNMLHYILSSQFKEYGVHVAYIERPFFRGGSSYLTHGLAFVAHMAAGSVGVRRVEVSPDKWRKAILGPGKRTSKEWKAESIAYAEKYLPGDRPLTDDEADAYGLLQYAIRKEAENADA